MVNYGFGTESSGRTLVPFKVLKVTLALLVLQVLLVLLEKLDQWVLKVSKVLQVQRETKVQLVPHLSYQVLWVLKVQLVPLVLKVHRVSQDWALHLLLGFLAKPIFQPLLRTVISTY
jgi:hypothetical protein